MAPGLPREIRIPDRYNVKLYTDEDKKWATEIREKVSLRTEEIGVVMKIEVDIEVSGAGEASETGVVM